MKTKTPEARGIGRVKKREPDRHFACCRILKIAPLKGFRFIHPARHSTTTPFGLSSQSQRCCHLGRVTRRDIQEVNWPLDTAEEAECK